MQSKGEMQGSDLGRGTKAEKKVFFFFFSQMCENGFYILKEKS